MVDVAFASVAVDDRDTDPTTPEHLSLAYRMPVVLERHELLSTAFVQPFSHRSCRGALKRITIETQANLLSAALSERMRDLWPEIRNQSLVGDGFVLVSPRYPVPRFLTREDFPHHNPEGVNICC